MTSPITPPLAHHILRARRHAQRQPATGELDNADAAYAVQAAVAAATGEIGGFKTARKPGDDAIMAPIFAHDIHHSAAHVSSAFGGGLGVELEIGFRLIGPPPAADASDLTTLLGQCLEPLVVIEIVDTRLAGPQSEAPLAKLADNQINAGLIIGPVMRDWMGESIGTVQARMMAGDDCLLDGTAQVPGGDALETVAGLVRMIGNHCGGLQTGQIIITGSLHPLTYVDPGTHVAGHIEGFGDIAVTID